MQWVLNPPCRNVSRRNIDRQRCRLFRRSALWPGCPPAREPVLDGGDLVEDLPLAESTGHTGRFDRFHTDDCQSLGRPTQLRGGVRWLGDHHPTPGGEERRAALGGKGRNAKRPGCHGVELLTKVCTVAQLSARPRTTSIPLDAGHPSNVSARNCVRRSWRPSGRPGPPASRSRAQVREHPRPFPDR